MHSHSTCQIKGRYAYSGMHVDISASISCRHSQSHCRHTPPLCQFPKEEAPFSERRVKNNSSREYWSNLALKCSQVCTWEQTKRLLLPLPALVRCLGYKTASLLGTVPWLYCMMITVFGKTHLSREQEEKLPPKGTFVHVPISPDFSVLACRRTNSTAFSSSCWNVVKMTMKIKITVLQRQDTNLSQKFGKSKGNSFKKNTFTANQWIDVVHKRNTSLFWQRCELGLFIIILIWVYLWIKQLWHRQITFEPQPARHLLAPGLESRLWRHTFACPINCSEQCTDI